ncbi:MAG TPA: hypothetical protein VGN34_26140 [Ktedonobacteraceae bacterium]
MEQIPQPDIVAQAINITEPSEPSKEEIAAMIATTLGETEESAHKNILHIVRAVGRTHARELLNMTLQTEEHGGILVSDSSRRQTPGEVFFHLAYSIGKTKDGNPLRPFRSKQLKQEKHASQQEAEPSVQQTALLITQTLGETGQAVRQQIQRIVWALGPTAAQSILEQTLQIEQNGGMMLHNGSRRRTPGGVFFHLVYTTGQPQEGRTLGKPVSNKPKQEEQTHQASKQQVKQPIPKPAPQEVSLFRWEDRIAAIKEAESEKGQVNVKITVIGRPGKIVERGSCIVIVMESTKMPMLPKGLPTPTAVPTKYAVYIASKQWKKVEEAIKDPEDVLIMEGFPKTDPEVSAIAVFATNVTTKKLQMAKKQPRVPQ